MKFSKIHILIGCAIQLGFKVNLSKADGTKLEFFPLEQCLAHLRSLSGSAPRTEERVDPWFKDLGIDPTLMDNLISDHKAKGAGRLKQDSKTIDELKTFPQPGDEVRVGIVSFPVLAVLGHGAEGVVYLVQNNGRLEAVKKFFDSSAQDRNFNDLNRRRTALQNEVPLFVPEVYEVDKENHTTRLQYILGLPVSSLLEGETRLNKDQIEKIKTRYSKTTASESVNVVLEVTTGKLFLIDPY